MKYSDMADKFARATKRRPCPVCGKTDYCLVARDGTSAICPRTISNDQRGEAGYFHKLAEPIETMVRRPLRNPPPKSQAGARQDWKATSYAFEWALSDAAMIEQAAALGVTPHSLWRLGMGWCDKAKACTFPMFNEHCEHIGVRLRRPADGFKFCVTGSSNGIFVPRNLTGEGPLLIIEGPTDAAAILDLRFDAIGRPNCNSAVEMTVAFVRSQPNREWVIVEDHDEPHYRPDGSVYFPGQEGATKLAEALADTRKPGKVIAPLRVKDAREWKRNGVTPSTVSNIIRNAPNFIRKRT